MDCEIRYIRPLILFISLYQIPLCYQNETDVQQELAKLAQIPGILTNTYKSTWPRNFQE
jgi:hypothetical protein